MKKIVWQNPDGSLAITVFTPSAIATGKTIEELEADMVSRNQVPVNAISVGYCEDTDLPNTAPEDVVEDYYFENGNAVKKPVDDKVRHFRNSWRWDDVNKKVIEDTSIRTEARKLNVRGIRNKLLEVTDSDVLGRLTGQALADVQIYRQELRDLGVAIDTDPENVIFPAL